MKFICSNCHEIIEESTCPYCGYITEVQKIEELIKNAKMAIRYGYSYRKLAQINKKDKGSSFNFCLPEASEYLLWLGGAILSGIAWDSIKAIAAKIYSLIKTNKSIDKETEFVFLNEKELYKFYTYIKDYENGLSDIDDFEYKYIEEEMMADFCAEMETEIYMKEKRKITIEERIQIYKIARLKIKSIVKR